MTNFNCKLYYDEETYEIVVMPCRGTFNTQLKGKYGFVVACEDMNKQPGGETLRA